LNGKWKFEIGKSVDGRTGGAVMLFEAFLGLCALTSAAEAAV